MDHGIVAARTVRDERYGGYRNACSLFGLNSNSRRESRHRRSTHRAQRVAAASLHPPTSPSPILPPPRPPHSHTPSNPLPQLLRQPRRSFPCNRCPAPVPAGAGIPRIRTHPPVARPGGPPQVGNRFAPHTQRSSPLPSASCGQRLRRADRKPAAGGGGAERDSDLLRAGAVVRAGLSRGQGPPLRCVLSPSDAPGRDLWFVRRARLSRDGPGPALDDRSGEDELPGGLASVLRAACVRVCARSRVRACVRVLPRPFPSCVRRKNALGLSIQNQERNRECWVSFKYEGDRAL